MPSGNDGQSVSGQPLQGIRGVNRPVELSQDDLTLSRRQEAILARMEATIMACSGKMENKEKEYWKSSIFLEDGKAVNRQMPINKNPMVAICPSNFSMYGVIVRASFSKDSGLPIYTLERSDGEELVKYDSFTNEVLFAQGREMIKDEAGKPLPVSRDLVGLLKEVGDFIEGLPEASKKERWLDLLRPRIKNWIRLYK